MIKVLVVDDEESIRNLMRMNLELDGYEVLTAQDGNAVLDIFKEERPEVVLWTSKCQALPASRS